MFRGDKYVAPLYRLHDDGTPELGASAVWVSIGDQKFLVTAAHAIDEGFIWFPAERGFRRLNSPGVMTTPPQNGRDGDRGDFAMFHLSAEDQTSKHPFYEYVDVCMIDVNLNYRFRDRYEFTGYPHRRERLDRGKKRSVPGYASITSESVSEERFRELGLSTLTHVVIAYQREKMMQNGRQITGPLPHGLSGGAVWKRYAGSEDRKLAAIAIEFRGECLIGPRISPVLEYIRARFPWLSPLIPYPADIDIAVTKDRKPVEPNFLII